MINKNTISFTITLTFIMALILISISFIILYNNISHKDRHTKISRGMDASRVLLRECRFNNHVIGKDFIEYLKQINFDIIIDKGKIKNIVDDNKPFKYTRKLHLAQISFFNYENKNMIIVNTPRGDYILVDNNILKSSKFTVAIVFIVIFIAFVFLYFITIGKLKPLKQLQEDVKKLAKEEFDITYISDKKDEISLLANEFQNSANKLKELKESRNVFIRNIMHELKTPITKGKLLIELENNPENIDKLRMVFFRLESLILEFATIEQLLSKNNQLNKKGYFLEDIVDESIDILMCDDQSIQKEYTNISLNIDYKLFTIAVKNLIDNGIKYSKNNKITIKTDGNDIIFENYGEKLKYNLENYFEPFFKGNDVKSNQSFGLGLYIVHNILKAHNMSLKYNYVDGKSIFKISTTLEA
jgi:two-component system OmpR family sensor kinase